MGAPDTLAGWLRSPAWLHASDSERPGAWRTLASAILAAGASYKLFPGILPLLVRGGIIAVAKVFSPQYLLWSIPLLMLVARNVIYLGVVVWLGMGLYSGCWAGLQPRRERRVSRPGLLNYGSFGL